MYATSTVCCGFPSHRRSHSCVFTIASWLLLALVFGGVDLCAQGMIRRVPGIAWDVRGLWRAEGWHAAPIRSGDPIVPGALLEPSAEEAAHSITILLPDGQRVFYECFTAIDCARGFRVPNLYRNPEPFAAEMLARIRAVLARQDRESKPGVMPHLAHDEVVAELDANNGVEFGGLSASLSNGDYSADLRPLSPTGAPRTTIQLHKNGELIAVRLPGPGLYELIVSDSVRGPRIDVLLAAVRRAQGSANLKNFQDAQKLMQEWDDNNQGWPIHDFQRAYLQALMNGIRPTVGVRRLRQASLVRRQGVTAEPIFTPLPGVFPGDTIVSLQCATPDAVIRYTVDNSEPFESSTVYQAPVIVKGTALTIKAFSESPGRKDSAVVTGIFRIEDQ
jgi:Chitobiase/beta-hexosaminidase C-terminal domain